MSVFLRRRREKPGESSESRREEAMLPQAQKLTRHKARLQRCEILELLHTRAANSNYDGSPKTFFCLSTICSMVRCTRMERKTLSCKSCTKKARRSVVACVHVDKVFFHTLRPCEIDGLVVDALTALLGNDLDHLHSFSYDLPHRGNTIGYTTRSWTRSCGTVCVVSTIAFVWHQEKTLSAPEHFRGRLLKHKLKHLRS